MSFGVGEIWSGNLPYLALLAMHPLGKCLTLRESVFPHTWRQRIILLASQVAQTSEPVGIG